MNKNLIEYKMFASKLNVNGKKIPFTADCARLNEGFRYRTNILGFNLYYRSIFNKPLIINIVTRTNSNYCWSGLDLFNFVIAHRKNPNSGA